MSRLAEYLAALAKLLGNQDSVHFNRLEEGSTCAVALVEPEAQPKVEMRIDGLRTGSAANDAKAAFKEINQLLRSDNAIGKLIHRHSGNKAVVINFPGREEAKPEKFGPFKEELHIDGELVRIGGKDSSAHAQLVDAEGVTWSAEINRELAQSIAKFLYQGHILRLHGEARWSREEDGSWKIISFKADRHEQLDEDGLTDVTKRLRGLHDSDWSGVNNIDETIARLRGHEDGLH